MSKRVALMAILSVCTFPIIALAQAEQETAPAVELTVETVLCSGVENRMPVGEAESFPADVGRVYLWNRVAGITEGETLIHHVWLREGQEMADVPLPVKGDPWRTYSYKTIPPEWAGSWEVKVVGPDGNVIKSIAFTVGGAAEEQTGQEPPEESEEP